MKPTFNAKLVRTGNHNPRKPTKVVQKSTGRTLARYESRRECGVALGIHESYVSLLVYGRLKMKLIDDKHGELEIQDDPIFKARLVPERPSAEAKQQGRSDTTDPRRTVQEPISYRLLPRPNADDDVPF